MIETLNIKVAKTFLLVLLALVTVGLTPPAAAAAEPANVQVTVEGKALEMPVPPVIVDGRLLVGVRSVGEAVGGQVHWDQTKRQAVVARGPDMVVVTLGQGEAQVNGEPVAMDVPAQIIDDRIMVPLRFIAEALGGAVEWNAATRTANIFRKPAVVTGLRYERDVSATRVTLTLSEPPASVTPATDGTLLSFSLYPAVIGLQGPDRLVYDSLMKSMHLRSEGRTVRFDTHLWHRPNYTHRLSPDGTELTVEFIHSITAVQFEADGAVPTVNIFANGKLNYTTFMLKGPDRMVIDVAGAQLGDQVAATLATNHPLVPRVRSAAYSKDPDAVRIVLDLSRTHAPDVVSTELGLQVRFVPQLTAITAQQLQGKTRLTFAASQPVNATVKAVPGEKKLLVELPLLRNAVRGEFLKPADGSVQAVSVAGGGSSSLQITVNLPYYLNHQVVSRPGDTAVVVDLVTSPVYGKKIWVDAGHGATASGYHDPGSEGKTTGVWEHTVALQTSLALQKRLEAAGATVYMSRIGEVGLPLEERPRRANALKVDLFISVHYNSMHNNSTVRGTETYFWTAQPKSRKVADLIHAQLLKALGFPDRKVKAHDYLVLRETKMPAVLLEIGFLSNPTEERLIVEPGVKQRTHPAKAAQAIMDGIFEYFWQESR